MLFKAILYSKFGRHFERFLVLGAEVLMVPIILGWTAELRILLLILVVVSHPVACLHKVSLDLLFSFSVIQSYFDSCITSACSRQIIMLHISGDHMLHVCNFLYRCCVSTLGQASQIEVNNLCFLQIFFVIELVSIVSRERRHKVHLFN